jgi:integrase/recombinase XerD
MRKREDNGTCIRVLAREYLEGLRLRRYSPWSIETYGRSLADMIASVGKSDARQVTVRDIEAYRGQLLARGFKPASVSVYFRAAKLFFRHLEAEQRIFESPAKGLPPVRVREIVQPVPTEEEMRILLEQPDAATPIGIRDRAVLETLYSAGIRRQELAGLQVGSVNLKGGLLRVMGKGRRERMAPLGPAAVAWLGRYLEEVRPSLAGAASGESLWLAQNGKPLDGNALHVMLWRYRKAPGIATPIGLHSIRRACATHMLRRGASPVTIQMLLGHASLDHLGQYLKLSVADLKRAHAASRVGR